MQKRTPRQWLYGWAISLACVLAVVAACNYVVDPYGLYRKVDRAGFNQQKEGVRSKIRHVKALELPLRNPRTLLMGSSRVHDGVNPANPVLQQYPPVYNLGLDMCRMHEALMFLRHALIEDDVKRVILGLDFFMFNAEEKTNATFEPALVGRKVNVLDYATTTLVSMDALIDSWSTVKTSRREPNREEFRANGFRPGQFVFWKLRDYEKLHYYTNFTFLSSLPRPTKYYADISLDDGVFADFESFLDLCAERGIDCRLYINPAHSGLDGEGIRAAGKWEMMETWKRRVAQIADARKIPLWDFSGYNSVTTEPVVTPMKYYWDSSHFTELVGDWILARVMDSPDPTIPADFGRRITAANIDAHLAEIRESRERYVIGHPAEVAAMAEQYRSYLQGAPLDLQKTQGVFAP